MKSLFTFPRHSRKRIHFDALNLKNACVKINFAFLQHPLNAFQKRATIRTQDYFYHPLVNTPFSLGIVLPRDYGRFRVNGKIEVSLAEYNSKSSFNSLSLNLNKCWPKLNRRNISYLDQFPCFVVIRTAIGVCLVIVPSPVGCPKSRRKW